MKLLLALSLLFVFYQLNAQQPIFDSNHHNYGGTSRGSGVENLSMPYLISCKDSSSQYHSSNKKILQYIHSRIKSPDSSKTNKIGFCTLTFLIRKNGVLDNKRIKLSQEIGGGYDEKLLKVAKTINRKLGKWVPGTKEDEITDTRCSIIVQFNLD